MHFDTTHLGRGIAACTLVLTGFVSAYCWGLGPVEIGKLRADDVVRGGDVSVNRTTAIIGAPDYGAGAAYVFRPSSSGVWHQRAKLVPADGVEGDEFGSSVAIDGDTAVVGAMHDVHQGGKSGSAYVFVRDQSGWVQQAKLVPDALTPVDDEFGSDVAIDGDTIAVSSPHDEATYGGGFVFVFTRSGDDWVQQARIKPDGVAFGSTVSLSLDDDTLVVGSGSSRDAPGRFGSAFVFVRNGNAWTQQARLQAGAPRDRFGDDVAIDGETIVVGAPLDETLGGGAAYVFERTNGVWAELAKLLPLRGFSSERFGGAVAIDGDRILIGASLDRDQGANSGSAYAFERSGDTWIRQAKLLASDGEGDDHFGHQVALSGTTAVVGLNAPDVPKDRGQALVFSLLDRARLFSPGDLNGDGVPDLAALTSDGNVVVTDAGNIRLGQFSFGDLGDLMDAELMADVNSNGAAELVVLGRAILPNQPDHLLTAEVRDLLTGELISSVSFTPGNTSFDLEVIPDQSGNGVPELALLSRGGYNWVGNRSIKVQIVDALGTGETRWITFTRFTRRPKDLEIYSDLDGNGSPELVVMGDYRRPSEGDPLEIVDLATASLIKQVGMGNGWSLLQQMPLADFSGNGAPEIAVLRANAQGQVNVRIRDARTRQQLRWVGFNPNRVPLQMLSLDDINGNGSDELVVFAQRFDAGDPTVPVIQAAQIKDSRTMAGLGYVYFGPAFVGHDVATLPDIDGNGSPEVVLLGRMILDGSLRAAIVDVATKELTEVAF